MYHQSPYVDANNPYVVARSPNEHVVSASPSFINNTSDYVQHPVHNLYASSSNFGNMQHMYTNPHASATPEIYMSMNNMLSSVNQAETSYVGASSNVQQSVSHFYSSASSTQYINSSMNTPMDREIGHATTSYLANYPQTPYATSYVTNVSSSCATGEIHNSASHFHSDHGRINENLTGAQVPSCTNVAYGSDSFKEKLLADFNEFAVLNRELIERPHDPATIRAYEAYKKRSEERISHKTKVPPSQFHNFGSTSLPKEAKSNGGQSSPSWAESKEEYMARMNEVKLKFAGNGTDEFSTPTLEELPIEYQQIYEALKKKREEEFERLKKQHEEEGFQEFIKFFPPSNNHVGLSVMLGQDKKGTLQANRKRRLTWLILLNQLKPMHM